MDALKRILSILLRIIVSALLLIFLFRMVDRKAMLDIIKNADMPFLFLAFFVFFLIYLLCLFRWEMLLKAARIQLPLKRIIISFCGGIFFNLFLPSTIGGDMMRSLDLAAHTKKPKEVVATVLLDRLSGYIGLVILAFFALLFGWKLIRDGSVLFSIGIITLLLIAILLVLFNKFLYAKINKFLDSSGAGKIRESIKNLHQEIHIFRHQKKVIVNNLVMSLLIQALSPLSFYFVALSLGVKINIVYFFIFLPIIGAIILLPISIGGLGLRDASTIFFFAKAGVSKDLSFAMSLLSFSFVIICGALGGLVYVLTIHHRRIQPDKPPSV
ncbi:MAG: lysylphosphatidylglycerol synthase transmembrane domain-containing protein [Candidatus Omnitrophota bacterium]|jgi:hypothetical protein